MPQESLVEIAVAVAVPLWLLVEQYLKWRIVKGGRLRKQLMALRAADSLPGGRTRDTDNCTGPAVRRRAA